MPSGLAVRCHLRYFSYSEDLLQHPAVYSIYSSTCRHPKFQTAAPARLINASMTRHLALASIRVDMSGGRCILNNEPGIFRVRWKREEPREPKIETIDNTSNTLKYTGQDLCVILFAILQCTHLEAVEIVYMRGSSADKMCICSRDACLSYLFTKE